MVESNTKHRPLPLPKRMLGALRCAAHWADAGAAAARIALTVMVMEVEPASRLFSSISLSALEGRWITSPAAIRFTTSCSSAWMVLILKSKSPGGRIKGIKDPGTVCRYCM